MLDDVAPLDEMAPVAIGTSSSEEVPQAAKDATMSPRPSSLRRWSLAPPTHLTPMIPSLTRPPVLSCRDRRQVCRRNVPYDTLWANHNQIVDFLTPNPLRCGLGALGEIGMPALGAVGIGGQNVNAPLVKHAFAPVFWLATESTEQSA